MTIPNRTGALALSLFTVVLMGWLPSAAQEPSTKPAVPPVQKKQSHRVPDYFGKIALTNEQRATIYGIQDKRNEKIDALEKQIAAERAAMLAECEAVLNETQKKLLDNLRKAAAEPKPVPPAKPAESSPKTN